MEISAMIQFILKLYWNQDMSDTKFQVFGLS